VTNPVLIMDGKGAYPSNLDSAIAEQDHYYNGNRFPEIDSIWLAKDGRRVRICKIINTVWTQTGWTAKLFVLPPHTYRQRRWTQAEGSSFTSGFYKLESN
jgi:hypothetical protein